MGASHSAGTNKLAITAMSHVVHFTRDELLALQKEFLRLAKTNTDNENTINRKQFHDALHIVKVEESDKELLDRLFTMFDDTGDGQINFKEFVCGISTILRGTLEEKLTFSFHMFDVDNSGKVSPEEMKSVLHSMNNTVSYFGDEKADESKIDTLVKEVFAEFDANHDGELSFAEYMHAVAAHPTLVSFVTHGTEGGAGGAGGK
uniref:EF-hand domain-containing protein n=1 Tax=Bicosoecida sp. CB-2014 TaxID=1486930 RepID=A0A7S1C8Q8_9STRA|mmetsp:Transcript_15965/g.55707  ORF Transcript_15965/g.55707 Transcript_15965/m.55707 type:complete len:204 (+) Transcript_15965:286-897(+)